MKKTITIAGLDIGSWKIAAVVADVTDDGPLHIRAEASVPSRGVYEGIIVDLREASEAVSTVMARLRERIGRRPDELYANVSGQAVKGARSKGMIPLSARGREISRADIARCVDAASTIYLPFDREILHRFVHRFSIDDQSWIKNPLGLYAARLSAEVYVVTANVNSVQSLYKCISNAGYDVREAVFTGVADGAILLSPEERVCGVLMLDLGSALAEACIFQQGALLDFDVFPMDCRQGHGARDADELGKVFEAVKARTDEFIRGGGVLNSVVLTGGQAFRDGVVEMLERQFSLPVRVGAATGLRGGVSSVDGIKLVTAIGLVEYGRAQHLERIRLGRNAATRLSNRIIDLFNYYF